MFVEASIWHCCNYLPLTTCIVINVYSHTNINISVSSTKKSPVTLWLEFRIGGTQFLFSLMIECFKYLFSYSRHSSTHWNITRLICSNVIVRFQIVNSIFHFICGSKEILRHFGGHKSAEDNVKPSTILFAKISPLYFQKIV